MNTIVCNACEKEYSPEEPRWRCDCGGLLNVRCHSVFPINKILKRKPTLWRYREALPIEHDEHIITMEEGFTPLIPVEFEGKEVWMKMDYLFPTGSYKDRGATVLISKVNELGIPSVVEDSSGNAGSAIAAYCARTDIACEIYAPADTPEAKLVQIKGYGARLKQIKGSREDTAEAALKKAAKTYYASHCWNPFFVQGTKTFAFEVWEQLGFRSPDTLVLPVGNGTLLLGAFLGFRELVEAGAANRMPRLVGVQAKNCAPLHLAFKHRIDEIPTIEAEKTVAKGIAIAMPVRGREVLQAVTLTQGEFLAVDEFEISAAHKEAAERGFYIEPTSAATVAGLMQYLDHSAVNEVIVSVFTGHGLKATGEVEHAGLD
jgi:threonine synthase